MNELQWTPSPTDDELQELDQFLRSHGGEEDLLLDGVHGMLTALAIGPEPPTPAEWLPELLHEPFTDSGEGERVLGLLARLNDSIVSELSAGIYEPILGEVDSEEGEIIYSARGWCEGFSRGIDLRASGWEVRLGHDVQLMELLAPIVALSIEDGVFEPDGEHQQLSDEEYEECLADLPTVACAVADYWRQRPPTSEERLAYAAHASSRPQRRRGGRTLH